MRYLNKIIFINSANIAYEEISVDGNVHFTGTQGVGKSTVLRALLFFYNADKQRLGIQQGQKSFVEFYFKHSDSYIVYEVMRETGAYSILVSRSQGGIIYRFIDAPYDKNWLIDSQNRVSSDWIQIRNRIDKSISISNRIDTSILYRDIIFGNTHDYKYSKYALVESSKYQNIPRSIQNVFLNTKLDANFVKDTIIQSLEDEDQSIELTTYRRLVSDFEREYDEIDCWYRKDRNGNYPVKDLANKIAEQGRQVMAYDQLMIEIWHQLNYVVTKDEELIPILEEKQSRIKTKIDAVNKDLDELQKDYDSESAALNKKIGGCESKLDDIKKRHKYYSEINILDILELDRKEPTLQQQLGEKQTILDSLLKTSDSIAEKYNILRQKLENEQTAFKNAQETELQKRRNYVQQQRNKIESQRSTNLKNITDAYQTWLDASDIRRNGLLSEQHRADSALKELRTWHPKQDELRQVNEELQKLRVEEATLVSVTQKIETEIKLEQNKANVEENNLERNYQAELEKLRTDKKGISEQIAKIENRLSVLKDSLYQWLSDNVDNWEDNIGKVIDEDKVLYCTGLNPVKIERSRGIYGVELNIDAIPSVPRTPDEYRNELSSLRSQSKDIDIQIESLHTQYNENSAKIKKKYSDVTNPLRAELTKTRIQLEQIPTKRKDLESKKHSLQIEEEEIKEKEKYKRESLHNKFVLAVKDEDDNRTKHRNNYKKDIDNLNKEYDKLLKSLQDQLNIVKDELEEQTKERLKEFESDFKKLKEQEDSELRGKGVDVKLVNQIKSDISELNGLLSKVKGNKQIVYKYNDDLENLFAEEPVIKKEKKITEEKLSQLKQKYNDKKSSLNAKKQTLLSENSEVSIEIKDKKDGLKTYRQMVDSEHIIPPYFEVDKDTKACQISCKDLIIRMRGAVNQKKECIESLKSNINSFNRNFKPQNAFHFNTMPQTDIDFVNYAIELQDFLDNNKLEEFRLRTSEHYKDILGRISDEVGKLMTRRADVDKIIYEINKDFREKNFAGVIQSIELRPTDTSDHLMTLLISIQSYYAENYMSMGELNLFSGDNTDQVNAKVIEYLKRLTHQLQSEQSRETLNLSDTFRLQFRVKENDNDTNWVERINNVGSDGTDILVKAMVNIMLINVFKKKASKKNRDFIVHCMMDEIGRLHPNNIKGILQFANSRNIYLINSSPTSYNAYDYKYTYMLSKENYKTRINRLVMKL